MTAASELRFHGRGFVRSDVAVVRLPDGAPVVVAITSGATRTRSPTTG
ncbi:hypothetical protein [Streptomyces xiaopingdaonensis]|nr:hypothetical protein [Streptomyces xiaopingdaonensis]